MRFVANMLPLWNKKIRNIIKNNWLRIFSVDNSIEISNLSLTPRDLIETHHIMTLIMKEFSLIPL